ncbi:MAG: prepilin-type N-terminal cleavage/methylation domain-containing protein [Verrucomicrobia bacterium]|nr:prepilin-type N-terminal cleavage/methylation domain-containing protein [Verrucomicrobiota bacterium]
MNLTGQNSGFSLVEVMCAILILGIALAGLTQGVSTALLSSKESELQTEAALIAAGRIELLRAEADLTDGTSEGECGEGLGLYRWKQSIRRTNIDGLHEVEVAVENARTGNAIYELSTMLFEPPDDTSSSVPGKQRDARAKKKGEKR